MLTRNQGVRFFSVANAMELGVNEAIFIQHLLDELRAAYMLRQHGCGQGKFEFVIEAGQPWMPWTIEDFTKELPFWSGSQIRRVIASCKKQGVVRTGNYNSNPWNQRLWYTVEGVNVDEWPAN